MTPLPVYWPCYVMRDDGRFRVAPIDIVGCDGDGASLDEAVAAATKALQRFFADKSTEFVLMIPPEVDMQAIKDGTAMRIEVRLP